MNKEEFWILIDGIRAKVGNDCDAVAAHLFDSFTKLTPTEILGFQQQVWQRLAESYRWDLWAVAYIVNGGCSDDGFEYFRGWLIAQGRDFFEQALHNPESVGSRAEPDINECEDILHAAPRAYENVTGGPLPLDSFLPPKEPAGSRWQQADLPRLYPRLAEKFRLTRRI
jgi:hypothetical protein